VADPRAAPGGIDEDDADDPLARMGLAAQHLGAAGPPP
jgi:hypothetical protein